MPRKVIIGKLPVDVEIYTSPFCPFSENAEKLVREVSKKFGKKVNIKKIDITKKTGQKLARNLGIISTPTIMVERDVRFTGIPRKMFLESAIKHVLKEVKKTKM